MDPQELHVRLLDQENAEVRHFERLATVWVGLSWLGSMILLGLLILARTPASRGGGALFATAAIIGLVALIGFIVTGNCRERAAYHCRRASVHWDVVQADEPEVSAEILIRSTRYLRALSVALTLLAVLAVLLTILSLL